MSAWARVGGMLGAGLLSGAMGAAWAGGSMDVGDGVTAEYKLTLNYSVSMRVEEQAQALINGPIDPFQSQVAPDGQLVGFTHTGLPTTINFDDGNRNFDKGDLTHNRVTAFGEFKLSGESAGIVTSGDIFYDHVYAPKGKKNANTSPDTVNKSRPESNAFNEFTEHARKFNGYRARLLDAYVYTDFMLGDEATLNLRLGQQVVAWGESLFLYGMALSQGRADATRAYVPGAETKEILLPTNQVAMRLSPGFWDLTFLAYYKLDFKETEIFPYGDYLSIADLVGPGGEIAYGSVNPAYAETCPGLLAIPGTPADLSVLCELGGGVGGPLFGAQPNIMVPRGPDILPDQDGQWGAGVTFPLGTTASMGLYHLRYHNANPSVILTPGFAPVTERPPLTTSIINQYVPVLYQVAYAEGIHLTGLSFSTVLFGVNVAGEVLYRQNADVQVQADISGVRSPVYTRGDFHQFLVSALWVTNPNIWFEEFIALGEAGYVRVDKIQPFEENQGGHVDGINVVEGGDVPFNDRESYGFQTLFFLNKRNLFDGWDFKVNAAWGQIVKGNPSLTAAFGALYGEDDRRAGLGFGLQYLQNFEVSASYNMFLGNPETTIGESTLAAHPYTDRDYVALNIKYNL